MSAPSPEKRDVLISKALSYLLRHGAEKEGLPIDAQGWVDVTSILSTNRLKSLKTTNEDLLRVVQQNEKQRFQMKTEDSNSYICASQGHTLRSVQPHMELLTTETMPSEVYHGTFRRKLPSIQATGLSRMARNHIHLTSNASWSKSGIRASCDTLIFIDTSKCLADGFVFLRSVNGVILCEGNADGNIPPSYFREVKIIENGATGKAYKSH